MKLEKLSDPDVFVERDATTTVANSWEELTFTFAGIVNANNYQKVVVFFDFGTAQSGATYYFDDVMLIPSVVETLELPLTFESSTLTYAFTDFGGAITTKVSNPDATGGNTSATVAKTVKGISGTPSQTWAGSSISLGSPIDFTSSQVIKIKTWSPQAGITVRLKLEKLSDPDVFVERDATTTVANSWEELTFTFAGIVNANNYQKVVVFFDFGTAQSGATYYFDDVMLETTASTSLFKSFKINLYPNPTSNVLNIESLGTIQTISVYNVLGQEVINKALNSSSTSLDVSSLNSGIYVVKTVVDGVTSSTKFIKQ